MKRLLLTFYLTLTTGIFLFGQGVPELLYLKFNGTGTTAVPNLASSPVGTNPAPFVGTGVSQGPTGQFGNALVGTGVASSYVNTSWVTSLSGSWTISFWCNNIQPSGTLYYIFGDVNAGGFRCFTNGAAGANNWILRGTGITDVLVTGGAVVTPNVIHFVYDSPANQIRAYLNGVLVNTVAQAAPIAINSTTGTFTVGGYGANVGLSPAGLMDEFRIYNRALTASEVTATWNQTLPLVVGPKDVSVTNLTSPVSSNTACYTDNETIAVNLYSFGSDTLNFATDNVKVTCTTSGPNPQTYSTTLTSGTMLPGSSMAVVVTTAYDMSAPGTHVFDAYAEFVTGGPDANLANDTMSSASIINSSAALGAGGALSEDFETWVAGAPGTFGPGWSATSPNVNAGWWVENDGIQNTTLTGPLNDHTTGGDTYIYTETSSGLTGDTYILTSPCIDLAGATAPRLSFWYHMFGATTGALEAHVVTSGGFDSLVASFTGPQQFAENDPWLESVSSLDWAIDSLVRVQFVGIRGAGGNGDIGLDDVLFYNAVPIDIAASQVLSPTSASCYGTNETVIVQIKNVGSQLIDFATDNVLVSLDITGPATQNFTTTLTSGTLAPLATQDITVTTTANLSVGGTYNLHVSASTANDPNLFNDTTNASVVSLPPLAFFTTEDFETGFTVGSPGTFGNGWTTTSTNASATVGWTVESDGVQNSTLTGPLDDHTPGGSIYLYTETSSAVLGNIFDLISPCVDLTSVSQPSLSFWYHMYGAATGTLQVVVRSDTGDAVVWSLSGQQQTAETDPWLEAIVSLGSFASLGTVQLVFRSIAGTTFTSDMAIDDINLFEPLPFDAGITDIFSPVGGCGLTANEDLIMGLTNLGSDSILTNVTVNYQISFNGIPGAVNSVPSPLDTIAQGVTVPVTIPSLDFSVPGNYTIVAWTSGLAGDSNSGNDTATVDIASIPIVGSFPYFQDFESGDGGWTTDGTTTFELNTPANVVINSAASGVNSWITNATGSYLVNEDGWVISPCFDFSTIISPKIEMSIWWESEISWDGAVLQSTIDNGATWQNVGAFGDPDNWYTDNTINGTPGGQQEGWTGRDGTGSNGWVIAKHALDGLAGQPAVRLRVAFGSDGSVVDDGFAFDDILIYGAIPQDASMSNVFAPASGCGLSSSEDLILGLSNLGADSILTNVTINYQIIFNGTPGPINSVPSPLDTIAQGVTVPVIIPNQDFSVPGTYTILTWSSGLIGDTNLNNDSLSFDITSIPIVGSYPYIQDFENGDGGWLVEGTTTFELAPPASGVINSAASGVNSWITNATGSYDNNENGWVISPCFDFTSLAAPKIEMSIWWESEISWDGAVLQSTIDNGATWQNVGAFGDPDNWYTDNTINGNPGGQQEGWTGRNGTGSNGWVIAKHALDGLAGQTDVRLRVAFGSNGSVVDDGFAFDDIFIYDTPDDDMGVASFSQPSSQDCSSDSTVIEVVLVNYGLLTQQNVPVTVNISGAVNTTITGVFTDSIASGDTAYFVVGTFNSNIGGIFNFSGYTILAGDTLFFNDSTLFSSDISISAAPPTVFPDSICSSDSASFMLIANSGSTAIRWFDTPGGNVIATGDTLITPFLTSTTTYYAQATDQVSYGGFTPVDNTIGAGGNYTFFADGLVFDALQALTINSFKVYPSGAGNIVITVYDNTGAIVQTGTYPFAGTVPDTVLNVNFTIPAGVGYEINLTGSTIPSAYRNTAGAVYPYEVPGVISIPNAINNLAGFYYFFYDWNITSFGCPSDFVPVQAVFLPDVPVSLGPDGTACEGQVLNAFLPQIVSYMWNTGDTTSSITANATGSYYVSVMDLNGCVGTDSVNLLVNPTPTVDLGPNDTVACDQIVLDAGNPGSTYVWSVPGTFTQTLTVSDSGTYYVEVTALGCSATDTITIDVKPAPVVSLGGDLTSCNPVNLDAGNPGLSFNWSTGDNSQTIVVIPPVSGSDTVSVTVTDAASGCATTDAIVITAGTPPSVDLGGDQAGCDSLILDAGNPGASYLWSNGATTQSIVATAAGVYSVAVTDAGGCEGADTVTLSLELSPVAGFSYNWVNFGFTFQFNNASANGTTISWDFGDGNTSTDPSPIHTYQFTGSFQVTQIVTNECGSDTLIQVVGPTSIGDELFGSAISVYPNPTVDQFWIEGLDIQAETLTIEVSDARGRTIMKQVENHVFGGFKYKFDLTQHAEGVYVVKISDGERTAYKRIVRE